MNDAREKPRELAERTAAEVTGPLRPRERLSARVLLPPDVHGDGGELPPAAGGALGEADAPVRTASAEVFSFWYPSWETWKVRRTLAYWISVMFGEGSVLFIAGGVLALSGVCDQEDRSRARTLTAMLVTTPYFVGALAFTVGAYCAVLEVINIPNKDDGTMSWFLTSGVQWRSVVRLVSWQSVVGSCTNLVGALAFNLDTMVSYFTLGPTIGLLGTWGFATIGGLCFTVAAALECHSNKVWKMALHKAQWWLCVTYLLGGFGFLLAGIAGLCQPSRNASYWLVDFVYFLSSCMFWIGSFFSLWMWKSEQYGLGLLPEINALPSRRQVPESVLAMHAEYGCGKSSATQLPWLSLYQINATASVLDVSLAFGTNDVGDLSRVIGAVCNFALSHGILLLGSVIHHVPTARPFSWLLMYMRINLLLYTFNSWLAVCRHIASL